MKISINGTALFVDESGEGETALLFLHFFGGSGRSWREVIAQLPNFRCIAPDLRGFGASNATENGYSIDESADDVAALIQKLEAQNYVLIGHSMGGKIALALAARRPKGLHHVVLLAPSPPTPEPMDDAERERLLKGYGQQEVVERTLRAISHRPISLAARERFINDGLRASHAAWRAWLQGGSREDMGARMSRVEVPVTVLAGECDQAMTPDLLHREVVAPIHGARLQIVPGAGHLLPLEAPDEVAVVCRLAVSQRHTSELSFKG